MARLTYSEQLKHPNWQRVRLEKLSAAGFKCEVCETGEVTLHVHHKLYVKGRLVWEYPADELEVLCENCHAEKHSVKQLLDRVLATTMPPNVNLTADALGLVYGYLLASEDADPLLEAEIRDKSWLVDYGIAAFVMSISDGYQIGPAIDSLYPAEPGAARSDAIEDLVKRLRKPPPRADG